MSSADSEKAAQSPAVRALAHMLAWHAKHPELSCVVLIDPAIRDAEEIWTEIDPTIAEKRVPIGVHESLFPASQIPCFYKLDLGNALEREVLLSSVEMMLQDWQTGLISMQWGHRVCGWLWVEKGASEAELAKALARHAVQRMPGTTGRIFLRYFDPRIIDLLWVHLSAEQRSNLLGSFKLWQYIDRSNTLRSLAVREQSTGESPKLGLSKDQWDVIKRIGLVNRTLNLWQKETKTQVTEGLHVAAEQALLRAEIYGLTSEFDLVKFAYLALTQHPRFEEHPILRPILQSVKEGQEFILAVQRITPDQWDRLRTELN